MPAADGSILAASGVGQPSAHRGVRTRDPTVTPTNQPTVARVATPQPDHDVVRPGPIISPGVARFVVAHDQVSHPVARAGEAVDIEAHLVPGKVTVFDFYAVWCGPCREVDTEMKTILESSSSVALRKINVVDWSSPVAEKYLQKVGGLPYVVVYGKDGRQVEAIEGLNLKRLRRAIEKGHGK